jgi:hypothetical protein
MIHGTLNDAQYAPNTRPQGGAPLSRALIQQLQTRLCHLLAHASFQSDLQQTITVYCVEYKQLFAGISIFIDKIILCRKKDDFVKQHMYGNCITYKSVNTKIRYNYDKLQNYSFKVAALVAFILVQFQ